MRIKEQETRLTLQEHDDNDDDDDDESQQNPAAARIVYRSLLLRLIWIYKLIP